MRQLLRRLVPRSVLTAGTWVVFELPLEDLLEGRTDEPEIRWASADDLGVLAQMGWPQPDLRARLEGGARAAMLERNGTLVACLWIEPNAHEPFDWLRFKLVSGDLWVIYTWVDPGHRGQDLFGRLRRFVAPDCRREGYSRLLNVIGQENTPSLRASAKLPARALGRIVYRRCLGITVLWVGDQRRLGWWAFGRQLEIDLGRLFEGSG